ncbi:MAG: glycosyltransferase [Pirellulales bacterium]
MMPRACTGRRLSIVVPVTGDTAALEETLVSVLENRPADTEVIVGLGCDYADPWNIGDEVTFVAAPRGAGMVVCVNTALSHATGDVIHVLAAGWRATPGWTDGPVALIEAGSADAVVPLAVAADDPLRVVEAGLRVTRGGRRRVVVPRRSAAHADSYSPPRTRESIGPELVAGFWSAAALERVGPGFAATCGAVADADLAVALSRTGGRTVVEASSRVIAPALPSAPVPAFTQGLHAERLFWRSMVGAGVTASLLAHGLEVLRHAVTTAPLGTVPMLVGRLLATLSFGSYLPRYRQLRALIDARTIDAGIDSPATIAIGTRAAAVEPAAPALRRSA